MRLFIPLLLILLTLQACYKPAELQIINNVSNARLEAVYWGDVFMADELLPGESSIKKTIRKYEEKLPSTQRITFRMNANGREVFLETVEMYLIEQDDNLVLIIEDATEVRTP